MCEINYDDDDDDMLIQLRKEQLSLVVTQCLFHASTTSKHAQLLPEFNIAYCVQIIWLGILMNAGFLLEKTFRRDNWSLVLKQ